jgi:hypothetical protein
MRRHRAAHPDRTRESARLSRARVRESDRAAVFAHYGTVCACCGTVDRLSIDHVGGDGRQHREEVAGHRSRAGVLFYRWLVREGFPPGFQVLCRSCNSSKNNGERCRIDHQACVAA